MLQLHDEFAAVVDALQEAHIEYAVCGGIAMAIHGFTRATEDIDLLVKPEDAPRVEEVVGRLGFAFKARPMNFASKIEPSDGDVLILDLLLVTPAFQEVWDTRQRLTWRGRVLSTVSREGLVALKRSRSSDQDLVDIDRLEGE